MVEEIGNEDTADYEGPLLMNCWDEPEYTLRADQPNEALKFAEKYFPNHIVQRIKKYGHKRLSKEDFDEKKIVPVAIEEKSSEPEIKNLAGSEYDKHSRMMKTAIIKYNKYLHQGRQDKAMEIAKKYFPQSELEYIRRHGHSPISGYQIKVEEKQNKNNLSYSKVKKVHIRETKEIYNLYYEDGTLVKTTCELKN